MEILRSNMKKIIILLVFCINVKAQIITTIAGGGTYWGDSILATRASLSNPTNVAVDKHGYIYIAAGGDNIIYKINNSKIITVFAGHGAGSVNNGDGGQATNATLNYPTDMAFDAVGNMYIADSYNNLIRMVDTSGIISTVAGNGCNASVGTGCFSGDGGQATSASLYNPYGIAIDIFGNLYIADAGNHCIRKVNTAGIITTVAGNDTAGYSGDGGPAVNAQLWLPNGISVDTLGNLYISDTHNNRIRKVDALGIITTIAGNGLGVGLYNCCYTGDGGLATVAGLNNPYGVIFDKIGNLYIADTYNAVIRKVDTSGIISTVIGGNGMSSFSGDGGLATAATLSAVNGITIDAAGYFYIADYNNNRIRRVDTCLSIPSVTYTLTQNATPHNWSAYPSYSANVVNAKWYWGDDSTSIGLYPSHTYDSAGWYNICLTVYNACGDTAQYCQNDTIYRLANNSMVTVNVINSATGINQLTSSNKQVTVYPNPSNGNFVIETSAITKQTLYIYDVNGRMVLTQTINGKTNIDLSSLPNGIYNISIISNESVVNKRVVIAK